MGNSTLAIVKELKSASEDFEFYPTTESQMDLIADDLSKIMITHEFSGKELKILDIGAGDGRVLKYFFNFFEENHPKTSIKLYAIEKSNVHIKSYRKNDISLLGTDFFSTNLISKNCDFAFTNPPYSSFAPWVSALISQLNFKIMYAIIPERWQSDGAIKEAIDKRQITSVKIIAESDFVEADRKARAKVHLVRFAFNDFEKESADANEFNRKFKDRRNYSPYFPSIGHKSTCPFQLFIENELNLKQTYNATTEQFKSYKEVERIRDMLKGENGTSRELVESRGVLLALLDNYSRDMEKVLTDYKKISEISPQLLMELGVEYKSIRDGVEEKLLGFRNVYWELLFEELDDLTSRLTHKNSVLILNTLKANSLDFTYENAVYMISYAVEYGNELIEDSLIHVFKNLTAETSILRHYKSNTHMYKDRWRYNSESANQFAKYVLDYRFVVSYGYNFSGGTLSKERQHDLNDIFVMLGLLGYASVSMEVHKSSIEPGKEYSVFGTDPEGKRIVLLKCRFYLNGNVHFKFDQKVMLRLNVTASRLLGWVRFKGDFFDETDMDIEDGVWDISDGMKIQANSVLAITYKAA
ncbi:DUF4942 domain-containing protein [Vibrio cholerae]|nr:DUF4942 domain-containing protein [Vibrio cholerae]